jgi:hypothetical protein
MNSEIDPEYHIYPKSRQRVNMKDEIVLKNLRDEQDVSFAMSMSKSVGGAFINELNISS